MTIIELFLYFYVRIERNSFRSTFFIQFCSYPYFSFSFYQLRWFKNRKFHLFQNHDLDFVMVPSVVIISVVCARKSIPIIILSPPTCILTSFFWRSLHPISFTKVLDILTERSLSSSSFMDSSTIHISFLWMIFDWHGYNNGHTFGKWEFPWNLTAEMDFSVVSCEEHVSLLPTTQRGQFIVIVALVLDSLPSSCSVQGNQIETSQISFWDRH